MSLVTFLLMILCTINYVIGRVQYSTGIVKNIVDGDTLKVEENSRSNSPHSKLTIRLICIDAPEKSQHKWGRSSTQALRKYIPIGSVVRMKIYSKDIYGRNLVEVCDQQGHNIALRLLRDGMAVLYPHRDRNACGKQYSEAENNAKALNLGVWSDPNFVHPSRYKKNMRKAKRNKSKKRNNS
ncbi:hypothetical protein GJ496_002690 [Pomphorhynchus laevis]|nr:hypothetical protein GJ496_002690 [Pomphorhynchus laevis]